MSAPAETHAAAEVWLTVEDAARRIQASRRSVYRAIRAGQLRAKPINGRGDLRIAAAWLDEWMARRDAEPQVRNGG